MKTFILNIIAITLLFSTTRACWSKLSGCAKDIAIGGDGTVWVVGCNSVAGGYDIYRYDKTTGNWYANTRGAVRIAADKDGYAWIVNSDGDISQLTKSGWASVRGCAKDIGIGGDGTVWIVGCDSVDGGYGIYEYIDATGEWEQKGEGAVRIAADKDGYAWVVRSNGEIFQLTTSGWTKIPGHATDIGVGSDGTVWVLASMPVEAGYNIYRWNGSLKNYWTTVAGAAVNIAVAPDSHAWVVNQFGEIFQGSC